jgi:hypothetical protein
VAFELRCQSGNESVVKTLKANEDCVTQVKPNAEEAVHDVRRAVIAELHSALPEELLVA